MGVVARIQESAAGLFCTVKIFSPKSSITLYHHGTEFPTAASDEWFHLVNGRYKDVFNITFAPEATPIRQERAPVRRAILGLNPAPDAPRPPVRNDCSCTIL